MRHSAFLVILGLLLNMSLAGEMAIIDNTFRESIGDTKSHIRRHSRQLPLTFSGKSAVFQFLFGFGIPVEDLRYEAVTSGIVFKSQYFLPTRPQDLRNYTTQNINGRNMIWQKMFNNVPDVPDGANSQLDSNYRWYFYKALELWATTWGLSGKACVLKSICEATQGPFYVDGSGNLWNEIAHILFTPSTSSDVLPDDYLFAARVSQTKSNVCHLLYKTCPKSVLSIFSQFLDKL